MNIHQYQRLLDQAQQFVNDGKWLHAAQVYQRVILEEPEQIENYFKLSNMYAELRNVVAAEQVLLDALKQHPESADIIFALGALYVREQDYDNALHYFEQLIPLRLPQVHYNIGIINFLKKNLTNAERHFRLTLEYDPEFSQTHLPLGEVLFKLGKTNEAIEQLQASLQDNHDPWHIYHMLAIAYYSLGQWSESFEAFTKCIELQPDSVDVLRHISDVLIKLNKLDDAEIYLKRALQLSPDSSEVYTNFALLALARSDTRTAKKHFNKAITLDPANVRALEGLHLLEPIERVP